MHYQDPTREIMFIMIDICIENVMSAWKRMRLLLELVSGYSPIFSVLIYMYANCCMFIMRICILELVPSDNNYQNVKVQ